MICALSSCISCWTVGPILFPWPEMAFHGVPFFSPAPTSDFRCVQWEEGSEGVWIQCRQCFSGKSPVEVQRCSQELVSSLTQQCPGIQALNCVGDELQRCLCLGYFLGVVRPRRKQTIISQDKMGMSRSYLGGGPVFPCH